jgi:hypothetical protein
VREGRESLERRVKCEDRENGRGKASENVLHEPRTTTKAIDENVVVSVGVQGIVEVSEEHEGATGRARRLQHLRVSESRSFSSDCRRMRGHGGDCGARG